MSKLVAVQIMARVHSNVSHNEHDPLRPLVDYLRAGQPFTDELRLWLTGLLDTRTKQPFWLAVRRRRGRHLSPRELALHVAAYERVRALVGTKVTSELCREIQRTLNGEEVRTVQSGGKVAYLIEPGGSAKKLSLAKGKKLSKELAIEIAACQFKRSAASIKKIVLAVEKASR